MANRRSEAQDEEGRFVVYGLVDPRDGRIHYVGRTKDLKRRLGQHRARRSAGRSLSVWFQSMRAAGVRPDATVLELAPGRDESKSAEARWIHEGAAQGWPLVNNHHSPLAPSGPALPPNKTFAVIDGHFVGCLACTLVSGGRACAEHHPRPSFEASR